MALCREDKLLVVLALLQLGLVRKKVLLFVNSTEAAYRLRLFLEGFGIRSALLSPELPLNSRHHVLQVREQAPAGCCGRLLRRSRLREGSGSARAAVAGALWQAPVTIPGQP